MRALQIDTARARWSWLTAVVALNAVAIVLVVVGLHQLYARTLREAQNRSQNIALATDQHLANVIARVELSLRSVAAELDHYLSESAAQREPLVTRLIKGQKAALPEAEAWSIVDRDGDIIFHEGPKGPAVFSVADRDYFADLKSGRVTGLVISKPLKSRLTGDWVMVIARAIRDEENRFNGAVVVPVRLAALSRSLSSFELGPHDVVTIRDADNGLIARIPMALNGPESPIGDKGVSPEFQSLIAAGKTHATYEAEMPFDRHGRIASYRTLDNAPLRVIVAISKDDALAEWRRTAGTFAAVVALLLLAGNTAAALFYRQWCKQHRGAAALQEANRLLEGALRQMRERDEALIAAQEAGRLGTYTLNFATGKIASSPYIDTLLGIDASFPHTLDGWLTGVHPDDREAMRTLLLVDIREKHAAFDREFRVVRPSDQQIVWVHGLGRVDCDAQGQVIRLRGTIQDISAFKENQQRLEYLAYHDDLTGLPNRARLAEHIRKAMEDCERQGSRLLGVCYIDLDSFGKVNETWGQALADRLLVAVAQRLSRCVGADDIVARLGGDEFVVVFNGLTDVDDVHAAARRLLETSREPYQLDKATLNISLSVGISVYPFAGVDEPDALLRQADQAMYEAKRRGKCSLSFFDVQSEQRRRERQKDYDRLVEALAAREFRLHYQPKVSLHTGKVIGVEALLRWQHPERGLLPPLDFLPLVEGSELTLPLGEWILREALEQWRRWSQQGLAIGVSVNIFGHHLQRADFVDRLAALLRDYPELPPGTLDLEVLETTALENLAEVTARIDGCRQLGVRFSIDDFGTGYSSLAYLRQLPVHDVKIDRSFVRDMLDNPGDQALVESIVNMAHTLDRQVVAEGVESHGHVVALSRMGCDFAQGYGIARPMPAQDLPAWVVAWSMPVRGPQAAIHGHEPR